MNSGDKVHAMREYCAKERYTGKERFYQQYRPDYPVEVIKWLKTHCSILPGSVVGDVGAGTGKFSRCLLELDCIVHAVEPNDGMRHVASEFFGNEPRFVALMGTAENTGIATHSLDAIFCAQSFHWFDADRAISEFCRVLKPGKPVCIIWNDLQSDCDSFHKNYSRVLQQYCNDYFAYGLDRIAITPGEIAEALRGYEFIAKKFDNYQLLDLEALKGRTSSLSYIPPQGSVEFNQLFSCIEDLFIKSSADGKVKLFYKTNALIFRQSQCLK